MKTLKEKLIARIKENEESIQQWDRYAKTFDLSPLHVLQYVIMDKRDIEIAKKRLSKLEEKNEN